MGETTRRDGTGAAATVLEKPPGSPEFYTTEEVASLVRQSPETVKFWRAKGDGPPWFTLKPGRRILYPADGLWAWLRELREQGGSR